MRRAHIWSVVFALSIGLGAARTASSAEDDGNVLLGETFSTLFNPRTAPTQKTMGLLQRSFLDLVEESRPKLEIAFVIDGTDSMSGQLEDARASLTSMMDDLELFKENNISYQLVVFRDAGSPSGEIQFPVQTSDKGFISDRKALTDAIGKLKAESGAPYFPELVDQGIHAALTQLKWSADNETSRWIFLIGDAPPFDESFDEPENKAARRFGTGALVSLAVEKGVKVNCILCTSDPEDLEAHQKVLDQTRRFMNALSTNTGGLMLDLSYDDIRAAVRKAAPAKKVEYEKIGLIRKEDVEQARRKAEAAAAPTLPAGGRLRVAVLPHLPLDRMSFDPKDEGVQLATELRLRLRAIPGVEFKDSRMVKDRYEWALEQGFQDDALLQMLATALNVDYVLWGDIRRATGAVEASTAIYDQAAGRRLVRAQAATNPSVRAEQLGAILADNLFKSSLAASTDVKLKSVFASVNQTPARQDILVVPVALSDAQFPLLAGLEALDQSLALSVGDPEAAPLLQSARESLEHAVESDKDNPLAHFLLANCLFNQARAQQQAGKVDDARKLMSDFARRLRDAHRLRDNRKGPAELRTEIEADYALLVRGNVQEAIKLYRKILDPAAAADAQTVRRAYWMLAGIANGDWGVDKKHVNHDEAKRCLTHILALWPDSSEAEFIRRALRWDDSRGGARFPHFPKENGDLVEMIDRSA